MKIAKEVMKALKPKKKILSPCLRIGRKSWPKAATLLNKYFLISDKIEKEKTLVSIKEHENIE